MMQWWCRMTCFFKTCVAYIHCSTDSTTYMPSHVRQVPSILAVDKEPMSLEAPSPNPKNESLHYNHSQPALTHNTHFKPMTIANSQTHSWRPAKVRLVFLPMIHQFWKLAIVICSSQAIQYVFSEASSLLTSQANQPSSTEPHAPQCELSDIFWTYPVSPRSSEHQTVLVPSSRAFHVHVKAATLTQARLLQSFPAEMCHMSICVCTFIISCCIYIYNYIYIYNQIHNHS
jgi:hypothetical protein